MNYLKSITSTVLSSTGVTTFPFTIGERIPGLEVGTSIWDIKEGTKKVRWLLLPKLPRTQLNTAQDDGTPLTLFIFDSTLPPLQPGNRDRKALLQLARNALKKLRTIRHPDV
jgi:SCY1-like protein 1